MKLRKDKPPVVLTGTTLIFVHDDGKGYKAMILGPNDEPIAECPLDRGNLHDIKVGIANVLRLRK